MKLAIEMFSIVIVVTIACIVFSSYISTENQNVKARDFYNVAVNRIEDSNCDAQVIKQCKEEAGEKGYMLVTEDNSLSENEPSCYVSMEYNITFPIYKMFGENKSKKVAIEGYAR